MKKPQRVTIAQVAADAQVSPMTVSYAYNQPDRVAEATRLRVLESAKRLGYGGPNPAARSLRQGRFGAVGVLLSEPLTYAFEDQAATRFLAGVAAVCAQERLGISLLSAEGDDPSDLVRSAAVDGMLIWTRPDGDPLLDAVLASGIPAGVLGGPQVEGMQFVSMDDRAAAWFAAEAAFTGARRPMVLSMPFDLGRQPARLLGPDPESVSYPVSRHRLAGAKDWCDATGLDWSTVQVTVLARNSQAEAFATVSAILARDDPPDAVMCMGDELALGVLAAAHARRMAVPDELAITGWDGSPAAVAAGLTTVEQSLYDQGRTLTLAVLGLADGVPEPTWQLVRRGSTRDLP